ncbi:restriction endonuclease subunit S [Acetobacter musti]|uniref:Restriction endonuclease subunit S n=1 Tax=Acetobacter musti TaxID=864732 RepID=A0ABX0JSJ1_9PROT|nr:restriction endonuclease subunit S [Acetobacter musti]NHN85491.1 restriction endonuclease subunit S [Acetobacter musti]
MLPDGWKISKLGEIARITTGSTPTTTNESFYNGDILFITPADLGDNKYVTQTERTLSLLGAECTRLIPKYSVLFSCIGTIGKTGINTKDAATNQQINSIFPNTHNNSDFIYYSLILNKPSINTLAGKQAVPIINKKTFSNVSILLPPLPEQKKIAAILSTWDRAIEGTEKLLANSQQQKKALMQQLLTGKKRLPGFTGEWKNYKLYEVGNITTGNTPSTKDESLYGEKFLFITPVDLGNCKYVKKSERMLSEKGASISRMIPAGSIFFSCIGTIGKMGIATRDCITNQQINAIEVKENYNNEFIYYQIFSNKEQMDKLTAKQAVPIINKKTFSNFIISSPSLPEQKAIAAVLTTADEEITSIESDLSHLRQEKKALMQQLLTGKRRVTVD